MRLKCKVVFPPSNPRPVEFVISRRLFGRRLLFRFASGESWWLRAPDADRYLQILGDSDPGKTLDLVWNFRAVHYTVATHSARVVPPGVVIEVLGQVHRPLPVVGVE